MLAFCMTQILLFDLRAFGIWLCCLVIMNISHLELLLCGSCI